MPRARRHLYDRPIAVLATLAAVLLLGGLALPGMRIRMFSNDWANDQISVSLNVPGLTVRETLDKLTRPAEEIIRSQTGAERVESVTSGGAVWLSIKVASGTAPKHLAATLTRAFADNAQRFPAKMQPAQANSWSSDSMPLLVAAIDRGTYDAQGFETLLAHELIPAITAVEGVAQASSWQARRRSVDVTLDPRRLAAVGMEASLVTQAVEQAARPAPASALPAGADGAATWARVVAPPLTPEDLPMLRLAPATSMMDVATVTARGLDDAGWSLMVNGRPGGALQVQASPDANVYRAAREVGLVLERACAAHGLTMQLVFDPHAEFDAVAHEILASAIWCALFSLVFLVAFLGRWRLALLVCAALPLSLLMAVIAMAVAGSELSLIALIGFLLASGMVVDNAIVVAESLLRARDTADPGERRLVLRRAVGAVTMAIIVSTMTTIAMFTPVVVAGQGVGRDVLVAMAAPIAWSLLGSLVVALVLVPMAFAWAYPRGTRRRGRGARGHARWLLATERAYGRLLAWLLLRPALGLALSGGLLGGGALALLVLPQAEARRSPGERVLNLSVQINPQATPEHARAVLARWHDELAPHRARLGVVSDMSYLDRREGSLRIYLTPFDDQGRASSDIGWEIAGLLTPDPDVMLREHLELAQMGAQQAREAREAAQEKAQQRAEEEARARARAAAGPATRQRSRVAAAAPVRVAPVRAPAAPAAPPAPDEEAEPAAGLAVTQLELDISAPDPRAVRLAAQSLGKVLVAEGGIPDKKRRERSGQGEGYGEDEGDPRLGPRARTSVALRLTHAAEEQGWQADRIAEQLAHFSSGERGRAMPAGWRVSFGREEQDDRTIDRLLDTVVFQAAPAAGAAAAVRPAEPAATRPAVTAPGTAPAATVEKPGGAGAAGRKPAPTAARPAAAAPSPAPAGTAPARAAVSAPLLQLVASAAQPAEQPIRRVDGLTHERLSTVVLASERKRLLAAFPALLVRAQVPDGVAVAVTEGPRAEDDGQRELWIALVAAAAIIYLLMCILNESLLAPLTVMTTVPAGVIAVLGVFTLARLPQDQMVVLGLFLLVGIVVNHGVVLVDRLATTVPMHRLAGRRSLLAVAAAARRRFTPVLLTSLTTIAGALPMALSHGRVLDAPIASLGLALAIGLSAATVFTLIVVPIVYQWLGLTRAGLVTLLRGGRNP